MEHILRRDISKHILDVKNKTLKEFFMVSGLKSSQELIQLNSKIHKKYPWICQLTGKFSIV